jgi:predicted nucleotidyltransferase
MMGEAGVGTPFDTRYQCIVKLHLENLPPSLESQRESLRRCLIAMDSALPLREVILFGSHARGDAHADSDVDLCLVADGAEQQLKASRQYRNAIWDVLPRPAFTLIPITPQRLSEKRHCGDHFFHTVLEEGVSLAAED